MKKLSLLLIIGLFLGGCQYNKVPNIQSKEYPRYLDTVPIVDSIIFKYPTKKHTIESTITTSGASSSKVKYTISNNELVRKSIFSYSKITKNLKLSIDNNDIYAECKSLINIRNKQLDNDNCYIDKDKSSKKIFKDLNTMSSEKQYKFNSVVSSMFKMINNTSVMNKLKYHNVNIKSGSILYKSMGGDTEKLLLSLIKQKNKDFLQVWNEVKKDFEYEVIVKGWGLYNNKRVIVTQFQQEIDMKKLLYTMLKKSNKIQNKEEFNRAMGSKTMFMRLVGYELYDPNTFIKVYSHNISYTNIFNEITKRIEITKIKD